MEQQNLEAWRPCRTTLPMGAPIYIDTPHSNYVLSTTCRADDDLVTQFSSKSTHSFSEKSHTTLFRSSDHTPVSKEIYIADLHDVSLKLLRPLMILVNENKTEWCAFAGDIDELVLGNSEREVITDMRRAVVDVYNLLKSEADNLGPLQTQHWSFLQSVIIETV